ncbi:extracellular solute-binding protein [Paenibacillus sp. J5C_2022]|uniref:extracellular solute-binding protein n=1 Tax=Paenibacillus sp. J5C2022 TaxID=2977129 RepID=UPI0021D35E39|nr:extracellular solute-binding protein [Paenibacillus sp. J5C2022]MCU6707746.1 extracellular solute-binding protein [Paenibacillus sp. J5C2022]
MKKTALILFSLMLAATFALAGCSGNNENKPAEIGNSGEKAPPAGSNEESIKIQAYMSSFGDDPRETELYKLWKEKMEQHIGKKLDIEWIYVNSDDYPEKIKLTLASGDTPDIMSGVKDAEVMFQFGNQGALLDIAPYLDEYAPNYKKYLESTMFSDKSMYTPEGKMFFFGDGFNNDTGLAGSAYPALYRFDIFEKHNIKIPENWDEFYDAAKKLKELYPDSYPVNAQEWPKFWDATSLSNHSKSDIYWNGEKYVYGPTEDSFKEGLMYIRKLYDEKLLDPEFLSQSQDQLQAKVTTGKSFMIPIAWAGWWEKYSVPDDGIEWGAAVNPKNENYGDQWVLGPALLGQTIYPNYGIMVSKKTKYPELIIQMLDYQYSPEMVDLMHWGVEGKTYKMVDGKREFINESGEWEELSAFGLGNPWTRQGFVYAPQNYSTDYIKYKKVKFYANGSIEEIRPQEGMGRLDSAKAIAPYEQSPVIRLSKQDEARKAQVMTAVSTYLDENIYKFLLGERDFSEWDAFKQELANIGDYQSIVDMMNEQVSQ